MKFIKTSIGGTPIGFLDDNPALQTFTINGVRVLGTRHELDQVFNQHPHAILVLSTAKIDSLGIQKVLSVCQLREISVYQFKLDITPLDPEISELNHELDPLEELRFIKKPYSARKNKEEQEPVFD